MSSTNIVIIIGLAVTLAFGYFAIDLFFPKDRSQTKPKAKRKSASGR